MGSPRHLWSGDWQLDSAASAEELARRRAQEPEPEEPAPSEPPRPSLRERIAAALRRAQRNLADLISRARAAWAGGRRGRRFALGALLVVLIGAGLVFAAVSLIDSGGNGSQTASVGRGWIGITHMENAPSGGVVITGIASGSPAASAGLEPGDVITAIGNQQVHTVADVNAALNGLVPGNSVQIQFGRGPSSFSTLATLTTQPHGGT
jgi:S1-C subfamily serine protease